MGLLVWGNGGKDRGCYSKIKEYNNPKIPNIFSFQCIYYEIIIFWMWDYRTKLKVSGDIKTYLLRSNSGENRAWEKVPKKDIIHEEDCNRCRSH